MAAARTQKRASANAGKTAAKRRSTSRASSSRTTHTSSRSTSARKGPSRKRAARRPTVGRSRLTMVVIIATIVLVGWSVYPVLRLQYQHQRELQSLESELESLKSRNDELRVQVDELKTPAGVEQLARENLGLVKPGEQAYVVTGGTIGETTATVAAVVDDEAPLWQRALDALFGLD